MSFIFTFCVGCPSKWHPYGRSCYLFIGSNSNGVTRHVHRVLVDYTQAQEMCKQLGKTVDMVNIDNEAEERFIAHKSRFEIEESSYNFLVTEYHFVLDKDNVSITVPCSG
mgnify:CR=1 FL=1